MITTQKESKTSAWLKIRKLLASCSENDLIKLIGELYNVSTSNKDFLEARFLQDEHTLLRYKANIKRHLAPDEPWKSSQPISLKQAKKILTDYNKATSNQIGLIDLMIHYVECGTDFVCQYGDMYEQYYISLESVFEQALTKMKKFKLDQVYDFVERLSQVVHRAQDTGWGYYDAISDKLTEHYPNHRNL